MHDCIAREGTERPYTTYTNSDMDLVTTFLEDKRFTNTKVLRSLINSPTSIMKRCTAILVFKIDISRTLFNQVLYDSQAAIPVVT